MKTLTKISLITFIIIFGMFPFAFNYPYTDAEDAYNQRKIGAMLECGKKNPKKADDCIKYGTDSEFYCCYIEAPSGKACGLVSYASAGDPLGDKKFGIYSDGTKAVCSQEFIKFSLSFMILIAVFLF